MAPQEAVVLVAAAVVAVLVAVAVVAVEVVAVAAAVAPRSSALLCHHEECRQPPARSAAGCPMVLRSRQSHRWATTA